MPVSYTHLHNGGLGHSAAIHSGDDQLIQAYGEAMEVGRIIVNSPSSQGGIGDIYNENTPSLTLSLIHISLWRAISSCRCTESSMSMMTLVMTWRPSSL